jgi:hypothetical protein
MAGYMESDHDYVMNNFELAIQLLDTLASAELLTAAIRASEKAKRGKRARTTRQNID